jgi:hypothetical protein
VRVHARGIAGGWALGCLRKKKLGGAHEAVGGEGGGRLGQLEGKAQAAGGLGRKGEEGRWAEMRKEIGIKYLNFWLLI